MFLVIGISCWQGKLTLINGGSCVKGLKNAQEFSQFVKKDNKRALKPDLFYSVSFFNAYMPARPSIGFGIFSFVVISLAN